MSTILHPVVMATRYVLKCVRFCRVLDKLVFSFEWSLAIDGLVSMHALLSNGT